jgi:hypothetical protein
MPQNELKPKTARVPDPGEDRAVLRERENLWRQIMGWSALAFSLALGVTAIGHAYWSGQSSWGPRAWFGLRSRPVAALAEAGDSQGELDTTVPRRAIDGRPLAAGENNGGYFAIMIDNHYTARPSAGLAASPLVYEALVEGGITRYLAFYPRGSSAERIGPVRSARPYYMDWAAELDAVYAHVGGSPAALERLRDEPGWHDLNQYWNGKYFWRDQVRHAPHNVYTSGELLDKAWAVKFADGVAAVEVTTWPYKNEAALADRPTAVPDVVIDYSSDIHEVAWRYDRVSNSYQRELGGEPHRDEDGSPIAAKNVIIQYHPTAVIDAVGRRRIDTTGQGNGYVLSDGQAVPAVWNKSAVSSRTRYFTEDGDEIHLNVGTTWVEVVPEGLELVGVGSGDEPP